MDKGWQDAWRKPMPWYVKAQSYFRDSFGVRKETATAGLLMRNVIKWTFDFARNVMIVGVVQFPAERSHSAVLHALGVAGSLLLFAYIFSYLISMYFQPFHGLKNERLAYVLNLLAHMLIIGGIWLFSQLLITSSITSISQSYLLKP